MHMQMSPLFCELFKLILHFTAIAGAKMGTLHNVLAMHP